LHINSDTPSIRLSDTAGSDLITRITNSQGDLYLDADFGGTTGDIIFRTNGERARIDSSGRFGIGTVSPGELLHLSGVTPTSGLRFSDASTNRFAWRIDTSNNAKLETFQSADGIVFSTGGLGADKVKIDSSGRLLVGTSSARSNYRWAEVSSDYTPSYQVEGAGATANQSIAITNNAADNYPPILFLGKSRGTSVGSNTVVPNGERIGQIVFAGNDGTRFLPAARIEAVADNDPGTNDMPGRLIFSTTADGASSPTERMRIGSSGYSWFSPNSSYLGNQGQPFNSFDQTTAQWALGIRNQHGSFPFGLIIDYSAAAPNDTNYPFLHCSDTVGIKASIRSNGGLANYSANNANLCDEREKKNIETLDSTWDCLKHWELKKFHYNEDDDTEDKKYGVIAQQVAPHCPEVITDWVKQRAEDAVLDDDGNVVTPAVEEVVRMGVKEQQMYWMAIKALQEAQTRIETLEQRLTDAGL
jgi:hypothetical protein